MAKYHPAAPENLQVKFYIDKHCETRVKITFI